jgi:hypothetical protein
MAAHRAYPAAATWSNHRALTALAALLVGSVLLGAGLGTVSTPILPVGRELVGRLAATTVSARLAQPEPVVGMLSWEGEPTSARGTFARTRGQWRGGGDCLASDFASGHLAESARLATAPLPPLGRCGDLGTALRRDARRSLYQLASARHERWTSRCPCPMYSIEQRSGLPWRPVLDPNGYIRMASEVRVYVLTETPTLHGPLGAIGEPSGTIAARRGLRSYDLGYSRGFLGSLQAVAVKQWDETSGYGSVEASRAGH